MKQRSRLVNFFLLTMFMLIISVPLLTVNKTSGLVSTAENRVLASFPDLSINGKINTHFISQFESWFNDNLGLRDKLVMANTAAEYQLFEKLTKTDTLVGKNNWLYYVTPEIIKDYQNLNLPSDDRLEEWNTSLNRVSKFLDKKNIPFIVMLNMDKKTIYPENYPESIKKVGDISRTEMISKYFNDNGEFSFFTPKEALLKAKKNEIVYSQNYDNAHWNYYGSFIGYMELMKQIRKFIPEIDSLSLEDFTISPYQRESKVYNTVPFSEKDYNLIYKKDRTAVESDSNELQQLNLIYSETTHEYINKKKDLPVGLIIGDSYLYQYNLPDLAESFSKLVFVHNENVDKIESLVNVVRPDVVVYETVERTFEHSMDILSQSDEKYGDYEEYNKFSVLPVKSNISGNPNVWLDYFDNKIVSSQDRLEISDNGEFVNISGWAIDVNSNESAGRVFLKIGDRVIPAQNGIKRDSVAYTLNNPNYLNSGFLASVNKHQLESVKDFQVIVISKDLSFQYPPVNYKIKFEQNFKK
ncbi:hypothetical protein NKT34_30250 [Paenibacillus polysaccharolyticus]|uniref:alginate O-acetyltransferase AlgX-related protein n=1 Tax=Paenibacillus polysaccharolyticus TaxID=582692 RepID=UPI00209D74D2|nr:hypothetical protein [Paenibacillus polysaccharolyticus]MCP1137545.1 hypothetical protein [Paenibacillus polysaccharolyticus]